MAIRIAGYRLTRLATECNGVGSMPSQELKRLAGSHGGRIIEVNTTALSKEDGFGRLKVLLSQGRLALPRHPRLLGQLSALEFEERDSGTVKIEVPERHAHHDDICMALCLVAGAGDVAYGPTGGRLIVPEGDLPPLRLTHPFHSHAEPPPAIVREVEERSSDRLLSFQRARRHPRYQAPGEWRRS